MEKIERSTQLDVTEFKQKVMMLVTSKVKTQEVVRQLRMIAISTLKTFGLSSARYGFCKSGRIFVGRCGQIACMSQEKGNSDPLPQKDRSWKQYVQSIVNNKEINTIPNIITMSRIAASPLLSIAIAYDMKAAALGGCILFGFTDWLDGYLANKLNQKTVLGAFLDPMADKIMIGALTVGLVAKGLLPVPLACVIIGRDVFLIAASFAMRAIERPAGSAFFDTTDSATFRIVPSDLSKVANYPAQYSLYSAV